MEKISIMLEEIGYEYKVAKIDINKGEQLDLNLKRLVLLVKYQLLPIMKITVQYLSLGQS